MQIIRQRLSPTETSEYLGCSYGKLMQMVRLRAIPCFRIGNRVFFFKDSIDSWLDKLEQESMRKINGHI